MFLVSRALGCLAVLLASGGVSPGVTNAQSFGTAEFVGTTPCGALPREFLGGIAATAECHSITWRLVLSTQQNSRATFQLGVTYGLPARRNPNLIEQGPAVAMEGTWEIVKGTTSDPEARVYRIHAGKPERTLSFVKVGGDLLHLLARDKSLMVGNGGWSYTLNRADRAEKPGENSLASGMSYTISPLAAGPTVFGVFEGRSPCHGIARELNRPENAGCIKVKWRVTLYQNPETSVPTTSKVEGSLYSQNARHGTWSIIRGTDTNPDAIVYRLEPTPHEAGLLLLKGDDNVLFILNQQRQPLVGHADFSYTLNRVIKE